MTIDHDDVCFVGTTVYRATFLEELVIRAVAPLQLATKIDYSILYVSLWLLDLHRWTHRITRLGKSENQVAISVLDGSGRSGSSSMLLRTLNRAVNPCYEAYAHLRNRREHAARMTEPRQPGTTQHSAATKMVVC